MPHDSPTVTAHIQGGLGNQLFCYAAARAIALRTGSAIRLNTLSGYDNEKYKRSFLLRSFSIEVEEAGAMEAYRAWLGRLRRSRAARRDAAKPINHRRVIKEPSDQSFLPELLDLEPKQSVYLLGHWQDERYFTDARATLIKELGLRDNAPFKPDPQIDALTQQSNTVSVHLRSYSEVAAPKQGLTLGTAHYGPAMDRLLQQLDDATFVVFSDQPDWAKQVINELGHADRCVFARPVSTDETTATLTDFRLMAHCKHHIVANSSFSWWTAWLGEREGSVIVAPASGLPGNGRFPERWLGTTQ